MMPSKPERASILRRQPDGQFLVLPQWKIARDPAPARLTRFERWGLSWWIAPDTFDAAGRCLYLRRWRLLRIRHYAVYLHHWLHHDWGTHLHDHARHMLSIGLWGSYVEELPGGNRRAWRAPWIRFFRASHQHRVLVDRPPCWTLIVAWPVSRDSHFYVNGDPVSMYSYPHHPAAASNPRC